MRCYICDFELVIPSGLEAIVACPNCKRNILLDGISTAEIERLQGQILALILVNKSQDETINIWKKECENSKIITQKLNERINELLAENDRLYDKSYGDSYNHYENGHITERYVTDRELEQYMKKLECDNKYLKQKLEQLSWDRHI